MLATTIQITNNPPHTPTPKPHKAQAGYAGNHHNNGGRQHGVEREPDSVSARKNNFMPNPNTHPHPPPTNSDEHMRAQENNQHTNQKASTLIVPHKTGLPRKEVIQPHLPVRLPCYDFVPIANPTFDHSPHKRG